MRVGYPFISDVNRLGGKFTMSLSFDLNAVGTNNN